MKPDRAVLLADFPRRVPVFPLPDVVLFPGALLPLHIFEPRYQEMVIALLAGDGLLGVGLLRPCGAEEYEAAPPFHETVCIGSLVHHEPLPEGRSNIALLGLSAARATKTRDNLAYRTASAALLADEEDAGRGFVPELDEICALAMPRSDVAQLREQLGCFHEDARIPLALLATCVQSSSLLPRHKLELLEERSVARRADRLLELLRRPWQWN